MARLNPMWDRLIEENVTNACVITVFHRYLDNASVVLVLSAAVLVLVIENMFKTITITSTVRLRLTEHEIVVLPMKCPY